MSGLKSTGFRSRGFKARLLGAGAALGMACAPLTPAAAGGFGHLHPWGLGHGIFGAVAALVTLPLAVASAAIAAADPAPAYPPPGYAAPGYAPSGYAPSGYAPPGYAPPAYAPVYAVPRVYYAAPRLLLWRLRPQRLSSRRLRV
jgi:hypothetical protein